MRIAIVEDEEAERSRLKEYADNYFQKKGYETEYFFFEDGMYLLENYPKKLDLLFLDIEMKHLDGIRTAHAVRQFDEQVQLLFVTRMIQYSLEGYAVDAADFLVKPIRYPVFCSCLDRVVRRIEVNTPRFLTIKHGRQEICCPIQQITYIEAIRKQTIIHRKSQENIISSETLASLESRLSQEPFFRCHKSCLVNLNHIQNISPTDVTVDGQTVPVSKYRKKEFMHMLANYRGSML
ncbi:MAG: LytTR family DNA-binding domain-containing protein [Lachnospiraceae bacterium]|nr:LytTR family DNA-binding domain-containing protein [Lachnospiraceae bacterium]